MKPDGSFTVQLAVSFTPPTIVAASGAAIPLVSLSPSINPTGGTLDGDQILYYAVSAADAWGRKAHSPSRYGQIFHRGPTRRRGVARGA